MEITKIQIKKAVAPGMYFVTYDTKHTINMIENNLMTRKEILKLVDLYLKEAGEN